MHSDLGMMAFLQTEMNMVDKELTTALLDGCHTQQLMLSYESDFWRKNRSCWCAHQCGYMHAICSVTTATIAGASLLKVIVNNVLSVVS